METQRYSSALFGPVLGRTFPIQRGSGKYKGFMREFNTAADFQASC